MPSADTLTQREFVEQVYAAAGKTTDLRVMPRPLLVLIGLLNPTVRAVREQLFQVDQPWVVHHSKFARAFGTHVTPHDDAIRATLAWFAASAS